MSAFKIKISDSFCEHEYEFDISPNHCIDDIVEVISKSFNVSKPKGKLINVIKQSYE